MICGNYPAEERVLLLGILKDKDIDTMLDILLRPNDTVVVTVPHSDRASDPQFLAGKVAAQSHERERAFDAFRRDYRNGRENVHRGRNAENP